MKRSRRIRGFTMAEMVVATGISATVLLASLAFYLYFLQNWSRNQGQVAADMSSEIAVRRISNELRQSLACSISSDGTTATYSLPAVDEDGHYVQPLVSDGVARTIQLTNGKIIETTDDSQQTLCTNVISTDPNSPGGTGSYKLFSAANAGILRSLSVMVVTQFPGYDASKVTNRSRVSITLRNIPELNN